MSTETVPEVLRSVAVYISRFNVKNCSNTLGSVLFHKNDQGVFMRFVTVVVRCKKQISYENY